MESSFHRFSDLFVQLGLASDEAALSDFINTHRPLPADMQLADAGW